MTADDLDRWVATVEPPCTYDYHGYTLCKTGPWGQGPVALQQLALLKGFDLSSLSPQDPDFIHTVVECAKLAFADREAFYGDPAFVRVPIDRLLSDEYNEDRRRLVGESASREMRPGRIDGYGAAPVIRLATGRDQDIAHAGAHGLGEPTLDLRDLPLAPSGATRGDTCHLDVIDRWGNMVSATPSGGWLQSSPAIPELGFPLSTRAQMFWLEEGTPASLAPGKRPRTTLTPSLALPLHAATPEVMPSRAATASFGRSSSPSHHRGSRMYLRRTGSNSRASARRVSARHCSGSCHRFRATILHSSTVPIWATARCSCGD